MPEAVQHCQQLGIPEVYVHDIQQPWPGESGRARAVVMLDVLEHVVDPARVLRHAAKTLTQDGVLVLTVPAGPWLMGPWDRMLGHQRRYTRRLLCEQTRQAGLAVGWLSHWNSFSLPPALVIRTAERLLGLRRSAEFPRVSRWMNSLLIGCGRLERRIMRWWRIPCGLSLVAVLRLYSTTPSAS